MKILRALLALALLLTPVRALAQEAKALTADCVITSGKVKTAAAHDGDDALQPLTEGQAEIYGKKWSGSVVLYKECS